MCNIHRLKLLAIGLLALPGFSHVLGDEQNVSARHTSSTGATNSSDAMHLKAAKQILANHCISVENTAAKNAK